MSQPEATPFPEKPISQAVNGDRLLIILNNRLYPILRTRALLDEKVQISVMSWSGQVILQTIPNDTVVFEVDADTFRSYLKSK